MKDNKVKSYINEHKKVICGVAIGLTACGTYVIGKKLDLIPKHAGRYICNNDGIKIYDNTDKMIEIVSFIKSKKEPGKRVLTAEWAEEFTPDAIDAVISMMDGSYKN